MQEYPLEGLGNGSNRLDTYVKIKLTKKKKKNEINAIYVKIHAYKIIYISMASPFRPKALPSESFFLYLKG